MAQREFDQYKIDPKAGSKLVHSVGFVSPSGGTYTVDGSGIEEGISPSGYFQYIYSPGDTTYYTPVGSMIGPEHPAYKNVQAAYRQDMGYVDPNYVNNIPEWDIELIPYNPVKPKNNVETYQGGGDIEDEETRQQKDMYLQGYQLLDQQPEQANFILTMAEVLKQIIAQRQGVEEAKCGTKLKKRVKKGKCGCAVTLKRVGGKLVNVDCNGNIVK